MACAPLQHVVPTKRDLCLNFLFTILDPSLKRLERIKKVLTAQADEITHLKEQRAELLHEKMELEKGTLS